MLFIEFVSLIQIVSQNFIDPQAHRSLHSKKVNLSIWNPADIRLFFDYFEIDLQEPEELDSLFEW